MTKVWHTLSLDEVRTALAGASVNAGSNRLEDRDAVRWHVMLVRQFKSLLVLILIIAALLSLFIGDRFDALAIIVIIIINALLGFVQEWKAETALKNLKKMLAPRCRVVRDGQEIEINAEMLVPGDFVLLSAGNAVPADIRLSVATNLRIDESALTGESVVVSKDVGELPEDTPVAERRNMAFMGTNIVNGHGKGIVVAIGMDTEFGRIAGLTGAIAEMQTNLQKHLGFLARQVGALALLVALAVFVIGLLGGQGFIKMAMTGISLAVAAVPEGLPAVVTITLALGMGTMARKKALLRHLQAAETLGAVSVICTDKTVTLTKNEMTVQKIWMPGMEVQIGGAGYDPRGEFLIRDRISEPQLHPALMALLDTGRKCNNARIEKHEQGWRVIGSPTEAALIVAAEKAGLRQDHRARIVVEHSFNSFRKRMSVVEETGDLLIVHAKGAPESLLPLCTYYRIDGQARLLTDDMRKEVERVYRGFSENGLRALAIAQKNMPKIAEVSEQSAESDLVFLGIVGVIDPPREEVRESLTKARSAGIRVILITGDSPDTALAVAGQIGLHVDRAVTGSEIQKITDDQLSLLLEKDILFARVVPEDKYRIVKLLQAQNRIVAMTGDGVNDAPALKQADIGIAMGIRGTDVARGAADIVLTDDNFATIIAAVEEGRRQYTNIRKFARFLVAHNIGEVMAIFSCILLGGPLILMPLQILWINLATDSVTALALSVEKAEKNIMSEPPRAIDRPLIDRQAMIMLGLAGLYIGFVTMALFHFYLDQSYAHANTMAFTTVVMTAQMLVLSFRHLSGPIFVIGWFSNPWLLTAIAMMTVMQASALYVPMLQDVLHTIPLSLRDWGVIIIAILPLFIVPEIYKGSRAIAAVKELRS